MDINKKVSKFNGTYLQIKRVLWSGCNEEKYFEDPLALYQDEEKERSPFLSCWSYLKEQAKWVANGAPKKKDKKKAAVKQEQKLPFLPAADISKEFDIDICGAIEKAEEAASPPVGQKKAKELKNVQTARALESRAETHKLQIKFKLISSMGDDPNAIEWKQLMAEEILTEKKKKMMAKRRASAESI